MIESFEMIEVLIIDRNSDMSLIMQILSSHVFQQVLLYCINIKILLFISLELDECKDRKLNKCHPTQECENTFGSYRCFCRPGFRSKGIGKKCIGNDKTQMYYFLFICITLIIYNIDKFLFQI